jgi:peptide/nickel transport system permease protein
MSIRETSRFFARRAFAAVISLIIVSMLVFAFLYAAPGSPEEAIIGPLGSTPAVLKAVAHEYGLDRPVTTQYLQFIEHAIRLDFGHSFFTGQSVMQGIIQRLGVTIPLGLGGFILAMLAGISGGVIAAFRRGKLSDNLLVGSSVVLAAVPVYATAILFIYVFGVQLAWFPVLGAGSGVTGRVQHLFLPVLALGLTGMAPVVKFTRAMVIEALESDDVMFARSRGVPPREILWKYTLRHTRVLLLTTSSVILIYMLTATTLVEVAFNLRGVGAYLIQSITQEDIPSVQGLVMLTAALIIAINVLTDYATVLLDPRVGFGRADR